LAVHAKAIASIGVELEVNRLLQQREAREEVRAVFLFDGVSGILGAVVDLTE
jgi:hypothetical protein